MKDKLADYLIPLMTGLALIFAIANKFQQIQMERSQSKSNLVNFVIR